MTVKELKEKLAELPSDLDNASVFVYVEVGEDADQIHGVNVYQNRTEAPYTKGDGPWDFTRDENGKFRWKGEDEGPAFVVVG